MAKPKLKLRTSWDDGTKTDILLAIILAKYNIPATFFIPTMCELTGYDIKFLSKFFEIGGHTYSHPQDLKLLSDKNLKFEIEDNKKWLENIISRTITEFCYPRGRYNEEVVWAVKMAGYKSARTTVVGETGIEDPYKLNTAIHILDSRKEYNGESWNKIGVRLAMQASITEEEFHIWGHSEEIKRFDDFDRLADFFNFLQNNFDFI